MAANDRCARVWCVTSNRVTFLVSVAAELPHKGTRSGTETMTVCEGAQGLREMLLLPDHCKYNLEASAAYIADQKAQGSAAR